MYGTWSLVLCTIISLSKITWTREYEGEEVLEIVEDLRRPIWNVAHMVNALYQVDYYLDAGANSLEFDVTFDWQGIAKYTYHGFPCDCFRSCTRFEDIVVYINYLRNLTTPGHEKYRPELVLLFMDLKVQGLSQPAKIKAGEDIAIKLLDHYWHRGKSGAKAYILISIPSVYQMEFVESFRNKLKSENFTHYDRMIGFDFSGNEDLEDIRFAYQSLHINSHIWQGDGITNCLPRGTSRLREAIRRRDEPGSTFIDKVYWWTVDKESTMRKTLSIGVDGMITNYPDRLISILNEEEFSGKLRLATYEDSPWAKYANQMASLISGPQGRQEEFENDDELLYNC